MLIFIIGYAQIATIIYLVILSILSLVEYYVLLFRGSPFMLKDIINIRTAATVTGTYEFQVPIKTAVCLFIILDLIMIVYFSNEVYLAKRVKKIVCGGSMCIFMLLCTNTNFLQTIKAEQINFWDINSNYQDKL